MHGPFCSREGEREGQSSNNGDDDDDDDHEHSKMKPIKLLFAIGFGDFGHGSNIRAPTGTVVDLKISQQSFKDISRLDVGPQIPFFFGRTAFFVNSANGNNLTWLMSRTDNERRFFRLEVQKIPYWRFADEACPA